MTPDPRSTYSRLLDERRNVAAALERRHRALGYAKLAAAVLAIAIVALALTRAASLILWVLLPAAAFVFLVVLHDRVLAAIRRQGRAARFFENGLARLAGRWPGTGESGERYHDPEHPYALDLDLFGKGSLFELLCTARTLPGQDTLAAWLKSPAPPAEIHQRQLAVEELRPRTDLREDLAVLAEEIRSAVHPDALAAWGEAPAGLRSSGFRTRLYLFTALGLAGFLALWISLANSAGALRLSPAAAALSGDLFLAALALNAWTLYRWRFVVGPVTAAADAAAAELRLLTEVLVRLEQERFTSPPLAALRASLDSAAEPPSRRLARLRRLMEYLDSRDNVFVRILEPFLLWTPHLALRLEDWRAESGPAVRRWLDAAGRMEALCSLASHAFEHPADPFPEFVPGGPLLEATAIGHPLLPEDRVVRNHVAIGGELRVLVVSGSNMSGKSTLLRTLGANAILAQAGSVVRAERLRLSPLALGASIRVSDSLQGGISRFYAEILRLRQILDLTAAGLPVLFLIDEFLHGTNSHDRKIGAEALVRGLVERGAAGLITTHDLALADIAATL
ncbi:MAG: DNA mismatch repair protein MutS, partial [Acidobacteria bacterium]|nr:DNA mismatch repair protein MutS [Acidobacteriota bacterium]